MNLKMFFAVGCTIKVFQRYGGTICMQKNTRLFVIFFLFFSVYTHISISIGLIGIYNKEELIALFISMHTQTLRTMSARESEELNEIELNKKNIYKEIAQMPYKKLRRKFLMKYPNTISIHITMSQNGIKRKMKTKRINEYF